MTVRVEVRPQESVEAALRRLRRLSAKERPKGKRRARAFYEKPGERRRRKAKQRLIAIRRAERERGL